MTKKIEEAWKVFCEESFSKSTPPEVAKGMRDVFFMGATVVLQELDKASQQPDEQKFLQVRDGLLDEMNEYLESHGI